MHVSRASEEFEVEELSDLPSTGGPFALYRLSKREIGTLEAADALSRRLNVNRRAIAWGGMKDRHAATRQLLTIRDGPRMDVHLDRASLEYLGQSPRAITAGDIRGNRFRMVLRGESSPAAARSPIEDALRRLARDGMPNYFDDQRFGSVVDTGELVAVAWCRGEWERALRLALAEKNRHDGAAEAAERKVLRERWGDWAACKVALPRSHRRSLVTYLVDHPADFRGAFERIRVDLRRLYLAALQSAVWNAVLGPTLEATCGGSPLAHVRVGSAELPVFRELDDAQRAALAGLSIPLPSARARIDDAALRARFEAALAPLGLDLARMRVSHGRDAYFPRSSRPAVVVPAGLAHEWIDDGAALLLRFELPRGSYATLLGDLVGSRAR